MANIIELRQLLAERFPGLRTRAEDLSARPRNIRPTGLAQLDELLGGGLISGTLTEIVAENTGSGSALAMAELIRKTLRQHQFVAIVDGRDSLDVTALDEDLSRLLWVRCASADQAMQAADLLLRDGNVPLVLLDLVANPASQLRRIPSSTWYRFQRIAEQSPVVCVVLTPRAMVTPARNRLILRSKFSFAALERDSEEILAELKWELSETRRFNESHEMLHGLA